MGIYKIGDENPIFKYGSSAEKFDVLKEERGKSYRIFLVTDEVFVEEMIHWVNRKSYFCMGKGCPACELMNAYQKAGNTKEADNLNGGMASITFAGYYDEARSAWIPMLWRLKKSTVSGLEIVGKQLDNTYTGYEVILTVDDKWKRVVNYAPKQIIEDDEKKELLEQFEGNNLEDYRFMLGNVIKDKFDWLKDCSLLSIYDEMVGDVPAQAEEKPEKGSGKKGKEELVDEEDGDLWSNDDGKKGSSKQDKSEKVEPKSSGKKSGKDVVSSDEKKNRRNKLMDL